MWLARRLHAESRGAKTRTRELEMPRLRQRELCQARHLQLVWAAVSGLSPGTFTYCVPLRTSLASKHRGFSVMLGLCAVGSEATAHTCCHGAAQRTWCLFDLYKERSTHTYVRTYRSRLRFANRIKTVRCPKHRTYACVPHDSSAPSSTHVAPTCVLCTYKSEGCQ